MFQMAQPSLKLTATKEWGASGPHYAMPSVANSDIDIASRALILIGAEPITSFTDSSTEATVANAIYEDVVRTTLCSSRWRFNESSG